MSAGRVKWASVFCPVFGASEDIEFSRKRMPITVRVDVIRRLEGAAYISISYGIGTGKSAMTHTGFMFSSDSRNIVVRPVSNCGDGAGLNINPQLGQNDRVVER